MRKFSARVSTAHHSVRASKSSLPALGTQLAGTVVVGERERGGPRRFCPDREGTLEQDMVSRSRTAPARAILGTRNVETSAILATGEVVDQDARSAGDVCVRRASGW